MEYDFYRNLQRYISKVLILIIMEDTHGDG